MATKNVIAVDLGAESGRVIKVGLDGNNLSMEEVHRFPNVTVQVHDSMYWDTLRLWHDIVTGIGAVEGDVSSIGVDTWGVSWAALDRNGELVANPHHYRDPRTEGMYEWVFERVPRRDIFMRTGIQFMEINTLYQVASFVRANSPVLDMTETFLMFPDLINYWLTGNKVCEFTDVTTTQFYNPILEDWDKETLSKLGIPTHIFPEVVSPGTRIGEYNGIPVITPPSHDTGSAVVAVPTTTRNYAYLSSGTWSLIGLELDKPVISDASYNANVTNEGGAYGTFRFLKNVMGLWLAQQCRATWEQQGKRYSYAELAQMAESAEPFLSFVDPDDEAFLPHGDMPSRIQDYCRRTGQPVPESPAQIIRTVYESLALKYRYALEQMTALAGQSVEVLHIVGGGGKNELLCQMAASATGYKVVSGPTEATAIGNAVVQFIELGEMDNIQQARELLSRIVETKTYEPVNAQAWEGPYQRFLDLSPRNII